MDFVIDLDGTLIDSSKRHYLLMEKLWKELPKEELSNTNIRKAEVSNAETESTNAETAKTSKTESINAEISKNESSNQAISENGLQFPTAAYMKYKADGKSGRQFLMDVMKCEEKIVMKIMKQWTEQIELPEMLQYDELYDDSLEFLNHIRKTENQIIYLTARQKKELVIQQLKHLGIFDYADEVIVVEPSQARQQKTEEVRRLQSRYAKNPVIIGDTENEYELAKVLGLSVYILNRGFRSREYWQARSVKSYANLLEILGELS